MLRFFLIVALGVMAYLMVRVHRLEKLVTPIAEGPPTKPLIAPRAPLAQFEQLTTELFKKASGSVVHITTAELRSDPFARNVLEVPQGSGSGLVWDDHGHIVTNCHVVQSADTAHVTLADHSVWPARLVGISRRHDLAVLEVPAAASRARALPIGTSNDLAVGQLVIAIGSPFGLDYTMSTGIISGLGREIPGMMGLPIRGAIQTDAAINPGNSGGPLLDSGGRLIGINTSILSPTGVSAGIGFALPVDIIARVVPQLIRYGREVRPVLGVELADETITQRLGLRGALVLSVTQGSPAAKAGLHPTLRDASGAIHLGDLIQGLDQQPIADSTALYGALDQKQPGDKVTLSIAYDGNVTQVPLVLASNVDPGT